MMTSKYLSVKTQTVTFLFNYLLKTMIRNQIDRIPVPAGELYLSGIHANINQWAEDIKRLKITRVFSPICSTWPPAAPELFDPQIKAHARFIEDTPTTETLGELRSFLDDWVDTMHKALNSGERVLVHCMAGISRSSTVIIYYLMKYHGYSVSDAIIHVRKERPIINPNPGFLTYLFRYERKATEKDWIVRTKLFEQLHFSDSKSTIYWGPESFPHLNINKEFSRLNIRYCWLFGVPLCFAPDDASISYTSIFPTNINIYAVFCQFSKTLNKILGGGNSICVCSAQGYGIIDVFIAFYLYRFHKRSFESLKSMVPTKDSEETLDQLIKTHSNVARRTKSH